MVATSARTNTVRRQFNNTVALRTPAPTSTAARPAIQRPRTSFLSALLRALSVMAA